MAIAPTLLTVPLEIRQNIYSYCLVNNFIKDMVKDDMHRPVRGLLLACHQTYQEASEYYYPNNTFQISLTSLCYVPKDIATRSFLKKHLGRVQNMCLRIKTTNKQRSSTSMNGGFQFPTDSRYPKQQQQWDWFLETLMEVKGPKSQKLLKRLLILDSCLDLVTSTPPEIVLGGDRPNVAPYSALLQPLEGRIGKITIQQMDRASEAEFAIDEVED